jgi:hypothetical protein
MEKFEKKLKKKVDKKGRGGEGRGGWRIVITMNGQQRALKHQSPLQFVYL